MVNDIMLAVRSQWRLGEPPAIQFLSEADCMTIQQLQPMHQARPFEPFDIYLADGRTIPVEHPEFLSRSPTGRTIVVGHMDGTHEIVDMLLVTTLKTRTNGSPKKQGRAKRS